MINFTEDPEPFNTHKTIEQIKYAILMAKGFEGDVLGQGKEIGRSKEFVLKVCLFSSPHSFLFSLVSIEV